MKSKNHSIAWLRKFLADKPNLTTCKEMEREAMLVLYTLNGLADPWRLVYPRTCYSSPQLINGRLVDLSTPEKVMEHYEYNGGLYNPEA